MKQKAFKYRVKTITETITNNNLYRVIQSVIYIKLVKRSVGFFR